jgi:cytochrome c-type biogenesis protein
MHLDLLGIYGAGFLTFVTPCVLPLVPIYLAALLGGTPAGEGSRGRLMVRAGLFAVGFVVVFTVLGLTASSLGGLLASHRSLVQVIGAALILVFGLKFLGLVRVPLLDRVVRLEEARFRTRFAPVNAVLMGMLFAAGWSPCVGPVLGSVLSYTASATSSPARGAAYLAVYGLGLATPLLLTAAFAQAGGRFLKRLRPHLPVLERVMGVALVLMALATGINGGVALARAGRTDERGLGTLTTGPGGERQPVIVELYGKSCAACKAMQPVVDGLTRQCTERGVLVKQVELTEPLGRALAARHHVLGVPTFLVLDQDGRLVKQMVGVQSETALKEAVAGLARTPCPTEQLAPAPVELPACAATAVAGEGKGGVGSSCEGREL